MKYNKDKAAFTVAHYQALLGTELCRQVQFFIPLPLTWHLNKASNIWTIYTKTIAIVHSSLLSFFVQLFFLEHEDRVVGLQPTFSKRTGDTVLPCENNNGLKFKFQISYIHPVTMSTALSRLNFAHMQNELRTTLTTKIHKSNMYAIQAYLCILLVLENHIHRLVFKSEI